MSRFIGATASAVIFALSICGLVAAHGHRYEMHSALYSAFGGWTVISGLVMKLTVVFLGISIMASGIAALYCLFADSETSDK